MNAISPTLTRASLRITISPQEAPQKVAPVRIIAEPLPWPDLKDQPNRSSLGLRWRCLTEEGVLLVSETTHPFADGAAALLLNGHASPDDRVTLRHAGKAYDSVGPMKLEVIATQGIRRILSRKRLVRLNAKREAKRQQRAETTINNSNLSVGE
ncbi:MAG: hypothetical protein O9248_01595 [Rhodobacteraceae bacterium]|nr:hypothetical protein [Paracoccaceae bacterium]